MMEQIVQILKMHADQDKTWKSNASPQTIASQVFSIACFASFWQCEWREARRGGAMPCHPQHSSATMLCQQCTSHWSIRRPPSRRPRGHPPPGRSRPRPTHGPRGGSALLSTPTAAASRRRPCRRPAWVASAGCAVRALPRRRERASCGPCESPSSSAARQTRSSWSCNRPKLGGPRRGGGGGRGEQRGGEVTDPRRRRRRCYPSRRCCHLTTGRVAASPEDTGNLLPLTR